LCLFGELLVVSLALPVSWIEAGTLLDRPFVELWLFAPMSLLAAVGLAGLGAAAGRRAETAVLVIAFPALAAYALMNYDFRASSCCTIVGPDDLVALEWVGGHLSTLDLVGIATEAQQLAPLPYPSLVATVDAGAWVRPLTGVGVVMLPDDLDLRDSSVIRAVCQRGVHYIYAGGSERSFRADVFQPAAGALTARVRLSGASVFQIRNCPD
jgi:hypothetical protein